MAADCGSLDILDAQAAAIEGGSGTKLLWC
jgi:hypothetical protein